MTDVLQQGSAWLDEQRIAHMSRTVTYVRDALSAEVSAAIGRTVFEVVDAHGIIERVESRDFLIPAEQLVLANAETLPQRGDRIRESAGGAVYVYEIMAPGAEPPWRYSDPYRKTLRVHTKHVETEDA